MTPETFLILGLVLLAIVFTLYLYVNMTAPSKTYVSGEITLDEMKKRLKKGDLLFCSGYDPVIRWFGDDGVSHVMMFDGEGIFESDVDKCGQKGVRKVSLETKIQAIRSTRLPYLVYVPLGIESLDISDEYLGRGFDDSLVSWMMMGFGISPESENLSCVTLVKNILKDNDIKTESTTPGGLLREFGPGLMVKL